MKEENVPYECIDPHLCTQETKDHKLNYKKHYKLLCMEIWKNNCECSKIFIYNTPLEYSQLVLIRITSCLIKNLVRKPSGTKPWRREKEYSAHLPLVITSLKIF